MSERAKSAHSKGCALNETLAAWRLGCGAQGTLEKTALARPTWNRNMMGRMPIDGKMPVASQSTIPVAVGHTAQALRVGSRLQPRRAPCSRCSGGWSPRTPPVYRCPAAVMRAAERVFAPALKLLGPAPLPGARCVLRRCCSLPRPRSLPPSAAACSYIKPAVYGFRRGARPPLPAAVSLIAVGGSI